MNFKRIIEQNDTKPGKIFDLFIQGLIILSLISFSIETIPGISEVMRKILKGIEAITVLIFTMEYVLRLYVSDRKTGFIFSFYGIIDLLSILPFYFSSGIDLRSIRIIRLLRLFRIFKVLRYSKAIDRFQMAFISIKEEMILFVTTTIFLTYISSIGIYYCESTAQPEHLNQFSTHYGGLSLL